MKYALILAGGVGSRAGGLLPKQFQNISGLPMVLWSFRAFREFDPECRIILVLNRDFRKEWEEIENTCPTVREGYYEVTEGGKSRIESVRNGLRYIIDKYGSGKDDKVFIHDSARPMLTSDLITRGCEMVREGYGAVPVVPLADTIRKLESEGSRTVNRNDYVAVQTPQIFMIEDIWHAYQNLGDDMATDDASVAEMSGIQISLFKGSPSNIKVTNPVDFITAETLLKNR